MKVMFVAGYQLPVGISRLTTMSGLDDLGEILSGKHG